MSSNPGRGYRDILIAVCLVFLSAFCFIASMMFKKVSNTISRQQQYARVDLVNEGNPFRQTGFVKSAKQKTYEKMSGFFRTASVVFLVLGPVWVVGGAVLKE